MYEDWFWIEWVVILGDSIFHGLFGILFALFGDLASFSTIETFNDIIGDEDTLDHTHVSYVDVIGDGYINVNYCMDLAAK